MDETSGVRNYVVEVYTLVNLFGQGLQQLDRIASIETTEVSVLDQKYNNTTNYNTMAPLNKVNSNRSQEMITS